MSVHFYEDVRGEWRWRLVAANGRIMADSSEGYVDEAGARHAWATIREHAAEAIEVIG